MTQAEAAFVAFLGMSCRARMSPDEQRLFDFHKAVGKNSTVGVERQIRLYKQERRKR